MNGPRFVSGRDLCNQILTSRPNPAVMASIEPVEQGGGGEAACPVCNGSGVAPWDTLTLPKRREWDTRGRSTGRIPTLVSCGSCDGTGLDGVS